MILTRLCIYNPVFATMLMVALFILGLFSYQRLAIDQLPDIDFPIVVVQVNYPGATPEIVESEVTQKVEEAINTIAGLSTLSSRSYEGHAVVIAEFDLQMNGRLAAEEVREKMALLRPLLRDEVNDPQVSRFDPASMPIFSVSVLSDPDPLSGQAPYAPQALTTWAHQVLKKRLENVRGVGSVSVVGGLDRQLLVYLRPSAMEAMSVTTDQVLMALKAENQALPVGNVRSIEEDRVVQINTHLARIEDFERIIVGRQGNNLVRLSEVADLVDGAQLPESLALYNGQRTVVLSVFKSQGDNTVAVVDGLQKALESARSEVPSGMRVEVYQDNSRSIRVSVAHVKHTLIEGAILTILIVFLFLNSWRSTVITGLTLPIALIGSMWFMYMLGFTINTVTLMALSLCVGLLIDDAIVVRENIVRHLQMGKSGPQAALDGTQEIGLAVLATTLSMVAVFLPIGFMGGVIGKFFHQFGLTIVAAVMISMFVSFSLDPMLSSLWQDPPVRDHSTGAKDVQPSRYAKSIGRITQRVERMTLWLGKHYQRILAWSLRHKLTTLLLALATFIGSLFLVPLLGTEFIPKVDFSETHIHFHTPVGSSLEITEARARQIDHTLREMPEVRYTLTTINRGFAAGKIYGVVYVRLLDRAQRGRTLAQMTPEIRYRLSRIPGITVTNIGQADMGGGKNLQFSIQGPDRQELERLAKMIIPRLQTLPGLIDLDSTLKPHQPTIDIQIKREALADLGLSSHLVSNTLRTLMSGTTVGSWRPQEDNHQELDVVVRLAPSHRDQLEELRTLPLALPPAADGSIKTVRLSQVADIRLSAGPNQINRRDMNREITITANALGRSPGEISADIREILASTNMPLGYRYTFGGVTKSMNESFKYAIEALVLGVVFIYMILASQFKSFLQPLALMSSLPLTLIGVVLCLLMFRSSLNMFSIIGVIMLMGLVTKNAILLIDFAIRAREGAHGLGPQLGPLSREAALLYAAQVRLRPILMTTLAMIFGMAPLAFSLAEGSEQRAPLGQSVIGGVVTSSLLTLVVVPVVYCYLDDFSEWLRRYFKTGYRS